jgi:hypothetical protein
MTDNYGIPEYYTDSVYFLTNVYGFTLEFGKTQGEDRSPKPLVSICMSPQHAKIMAALLKKNVEEYERRIGAIILPDSLYKDLGVPLP